jgi:hypothetical protein
VQNFFTFVMVCVLLLCPLMCRAEGDACCQDEAQTTDRCHEESELPANAPSDCGSCICDGALKQTVSDEDSTASTLRPVPSLLPGLIRPDSFDLSALRRRSSPTPCDWLAWRPSQRTRARLQNFRC